MRNFFSGVCKLSFLAFGAVPALSLAAWTHFDPSDTSKVPKKFSQTGFYSNWQAKTVTAEAAPFEVNTPLWSDNAVKSRWILLKPGSAKVTFASDSDYYAYPDGAVFVKLFQHDTIPGNAASRIYWETRVLVNKKTLDSNSMKQFDYWYSFSYKWKADGSEATLVPASGFDTSLTIRVNGQKTFRKWTFPSVGACNQCHRQYDLNGDAYQGRAVLGFYTPQINRASASSPGVNQIAQLFQKNILGWSKTAPTEAEISKLPKWAKVDDETADINTRARAYIAANCSGCHGARGLATHATPHVAELNYDFYKQTGGVLSPSMELRNVSVGVWDLQPITVNGKTIEPALIVPGHPEISVLLYRMKHRNRLAPTEPDAFSQAEGQMPPVGVFEEDTVATKMITRWIQGLPEVAAIRKGDAGYAAKAPVLRGNILTLPGAPASIAGANASLIGLDGRRHALSAISEGRFRLPSGLAPGVYLLKTDGGSFTLML